MTTLVAPPTGALRRDGQSGAAAIDESTPLVQVGTARLGFWSAVLVALLTAAFVVANVLAPAPPWRGIAGYVRDFSVAPMLWMLPAFGLMLAFVVLMACIEAYAPADRKLLARIAFAFTLLYAGVIGVNYYVQWMAVRPSILAGETEGLALFSLANPTGLLYALEGLAYLFQETAMLFAAFVFAGPGLPRAIRWSFLGNAAAGYVGVPGIVLGGGWFVLVVISTLAWAALLVASGALLAVLFRRADPQPRAAVGQQATDP